MVLTSEARKRPRPSRNGARKSPVGRAIIASARMESGVATPDHRAPSNTGTMSWATADRPKKIGNDNSAGTRIDLPR